MSPWVVPSSDTRTWPSTKKFVASLYILIRIGAREGQRYCTLCSAAYRLRELKALLASTSYTASVSSSLKAAFIAWTAASIPAI